MALSKYFPKIILLSIPLLYVLVVLLHVTVRGGKKTIIIIFLLLLLVVITMLTRYRKKPEYCIRITISRAAPFSILIRDLDYLSRLLTTLSKEYGRTLVTAPSNKGAILCTRYSGIIDMANIIDENTSTLLIEPRRHVSYEGENRG